jgi:trk system potassium uptake protein TrkA
MVAHVRAMSNSQGGNVETVYKLFGNSVEALEFIAPDNAPYLNKPLKELKMKPNILIAAIVRGRKSIIPYGDTVINKRDNVIVVTSDTKLEDLKDAFEL